MVEDGYRLYRLIREGPTEGVILATVPIGIMSPFWLRTIILAMSRVVRRNCESACA